MEKKMTITMNENSITFKGSEGITTADALVIAINLIEEVKEQIEKITGSEKVSLEDFILTTVRGLRSENKDEEQN